MFRAYDFDSDGWLCMSETRRFANFHGFKGADEQWVKEFELLCEERKADSSKGISLATFTALVDAETSGCISTDEDLNRMIKLLEQGRSGSGAASARNRSAKTSTSAAGGRGQAREGKRDDRDAEADEFFLKLKRTVNWYNRHGNLATPIHLPAVAEALSEIRSSQAMRILYELDALSKCETAMADATGWIVSEARARKKLYEKDQDRPKAGKGEKGEERLREREPERRERDDGSWRRSEGASGPKASPGGTPDARRVAPISAGNGTTRVSDHVAPREPRGSDSAPGGKGKGKGSVSADPEDEGEFRQKLKRTITWYNRHGGLLAPIRYQAIIDGLGGADPRQAMRILNDLDQANAEAVLSDPTLWILDELKRRAPTSAAATTSGAGAGRSRPGPAPTEGAAAKPSSSKPGSLTAAMPSRLGPGLTSMPGRLGPGGATGRTGAAAASTA